MTSTTGEHAAGHGHGELPLIWTPQWGPCCWPVEWRVSPTATIHQYFTLWIFCRQGVREGRVGSCSTEVGCHRATEPSWDTRGETGPNYCFWPVNTHINMQKHRYWGIIERLPPLLQSGSYLCSHKPTRPPHPTPLQITHKAWKITGLNCSTESHTVQTVSTNSVTGKTHKR